MTEAARELARRLAEAATERNAENVVALAVPPGAHASLLELCARLEFEVHTGHGVDRCTEP